MNTVAKDPLLASAASPRGIARGRAPLLSAAGALAIAAGCSLAGCRSSSSKSDQSPKSDPAGAVEPAAARPPAAPFKVAFNTWLGYSPLVIAKEKSFLKEAGLDVEFSILESIGEKNSALLRGAIDAVGHTADSAVTSASAGVDGQIIYVFDLSNGADGILARRSIKGIADFKGQKVALEPGFTGHFFFLSLLSEAGLTPADVTIVPMDTGSAGSAFAAGQVEAAVTWEPWIGKTKTMKDAHVVVTSADRPGLIVDVLYMNRAAIQRRPEDVKAMILAMGRAVDWYNDHTAEGDEVIARFWKLPLPEEKETVAGIKFMSLPRNAELFGTESAPGQLLDTVRRANDVWLKAGITKKPVEPASVIDFASVNRAAKEKR
ncbi:ABC transporter substrate-binding protein [Sorangium sp. So ce1182]|uniref:ABC transporter substrate-binding protein n=1 Tax=Sorangium sp. So ce1182 TaxID=3133334 RepID=UPI003F5FBB7B